jgi:dTMP kinase
VFITLEGGEGVGKTTQQALLALQLRQAGYPCLCTREPGGTALGRALREILLHGDPLTPLAELFLYAADRAEHVQKCILPALAAGQVVVCDRFTDSTLAYQGYGRGLDLQQVRQLNHLATGGLQPHLTLWLDLPPEVGLARKASGPLARTGSCRQARTGAPGVSPPRPPGLPRLWLLPSRSGLSALTPRDPPWRWLPASGRWSSLACWQQSQGPRRKVKMWLKRGEQGAAQASLGRLGQGGFAAP